MHCPSPGNMPEFWRLWLFCCLRFDCYFTFLLSPSFPLPLLCCAYVSAGFPRVQHTQFTTSMRAQTGRHGGVNCDTVHVAVASHACLLKGSPPLRAGAFAAGIVCSCLFRSVPPRLVVRNSCGRAYLSYRAYRVDSKVDLLRVFQGR